MNGKSYDCSKLCFINWDDVRKDQNAGFSLIRAFPYDIGKRQSEQHMMFFTREKNPFKARKKMKEFEAKNSQNISSLKNISENILFFYNSTFVLQSYNFESGSFDLTGLGKGGWAQRPCHIHGGDSHVGAYFPRCSGRAFRVKVPEVFAEKIEGIKSSQRNGVRGVVVFKPKHFVDVGSDPDAYRLRSNKKVLPALSSELLRIRFLDLAGDKLYDALDVRPIQESE